MSLVRLLASFVSLDPSNCCAVFCLMSQHTTKTYIDIIAAIFYFLYLRELISVLQLHDLRVCQVSAHFVCLQVVMSTCGCKLIEIS